MAIIETLTATALGGGFAIMGSWFTNKFNKQNAETQRAYDKWKAKRETYLNKGEEIYSTFNVWMVNVSKISTMYAFRMNGAYSEEELAFRLKGLEIHSQKPKLTALIDIYFPELSKNFLSLQGQVFETHKYYMENLSKSPNLPLSSEILDQATNFVHEAEKFQKELSEIIRSYH
ncbi:MAG: hypothetical protein P4L95_03955 [Rouxiella aceris]|uniref:hypothetical protein n=1 Tax=Rouxiella aceris TaxID=2703884 RepID=UPI00284260A5|nr:hypothetical protein [Rouxiella aceris]MDR3431055.1 hypothetical protein [Rouxiella aceris]